MTKKKRFCTEIEVNNIISTVHRLNDKKIHKRSMTKKKRFCTEIEVNI